MKKNIILAAVAALTLSACSMSKPSPSDKAAAVDHPPAITAQDLQHHRYELISVDGEAVNSAQPRPGPTIEFGEKMHVSGGMCNRFMGQGELQNSVLTVKQLASTMMLCNDKQLNKWDQLIGEVLANGAKVTLQNNQLTLTQGKHQLVYQTKDLVN
ncbi:heat shock protein HslJ [Rouxiella sp. Mn2063]|uniref:heat shock protein HslJ n=1 Tax=Rouxiella sp. Mn2063 TaxID=3395262 RepID=UPI003BCA62C9